MLTTMRVFTDTLTASEQAREITGSSCVTSPSRVEPGMPSSSTTPTAKRQRLMMNESPYAHLDAVRQTKVSSIPTLTDRYGHIVSRLSAV